MANGVWSFKTRRDIFGVKGTWLLSIPGAGLYNFTLLGSRRKEIHNNILIHTMAIYVE